MQSRRGFDLALPFWITQEGETLLTSIPCSWGLTRTCCSSRRSMRACWRAEHWRLYWGTSSDFASGLVSSLNRKFAKYRRE